MKQKKRPAPTPTRYFSFTKKYPWICRDLKTEVFVGPPIPKDSKVPDPIGLGNAALWDTGASGSVITEQVVRQHGLKPVGMTNVQHAGGISTRNTYLISLYLPNRVVVPQVKVTEGILGPNLDLLVGMDIIIQGDFVVTNRNGETWFTFRMPSLQRYDFVKYPNLHLDRACTCGSGKTYKNCCAKSVGAMPVSK